MLTKNYTGLNEIDLVNQANEDMNKYETGGKYSTVQLSDIQKIETFLQRAEFVGVAGGAETRKRAQEILTRDAGIQFTKKSYIQPHQGTTDRKKLTQTLENRGNRTFNHVGIRY